MASPFFLYSSVNGKMFAVAQYVLAGYYQKMIREQQTDIVIIGGGGAAWMGRTVAMTEETDWIGGQLTSLAVPPDENKWIETHGGTKTYQDFRNRVRADAESLASFQRALEGFGVRLSWPA